MELFNLLQVYYKVISEIFLIAGPWLGGVLISMISGGGDSAWYKKLRKPRFCPPPVVFPLVWTVLYCTLGYASLLVWKSGKGYCFFESTASLREFIQSPLGLFWGHMLLNYSWSPIFFKAHRIGLAVIVSSLMVVSGYACVYWFYQVNQMAAYWMLPYLAWITFATFLNYSIFVANPTKRSVKKRH